MQRHYATRTSGIDTRRTSHAIFAVRLAFIVAIALLGYSSLISSVANAASNAVSGKQSLDSIRAAAEEYVRSTAAEQLSVDPANTMVSAGDLDARLQFTACAGPLRTFTLNNALLSARNTIGVRCEQGAEWTVYLPVIVESNANVLVLRHPASRDDRLVAADVDRQLRRVPGFGTQYIGDVAKLAEYRLKRGIPAGTILTGDMLRRDVVIRRGQRVTLIANVGGIDVRASGTALSDGGNADRIRVQNSSSHKVVEGVVEEGNLVRVGM